MFISYIEHGKGSNFLGTNKGTGTVPLILKQIGLSHKS